MTADETVDPKKVWRIAARLRLTCKAIDERAGKYRSWFEKTMDRIAAGKGVEPATVGALCQGLYDRPPTDDDLTSILATTPSPAKKRGRKASAK